MRRERIRGEKEATSARMSLLESSKGRIGFFEFSRPGGGQRLMPRYIYAFLDVGDRWLDGIVDRQLDV